MVRIPYGTPAQESMEFVYLTISILGLWNKWTLFRISSIWVIIHSSYYLSELNQTIFQKLFAQLMYEIMQSQPQGLVDYLHACG